MQASLDLFAEPVPAPTPATRTSRPLHPTVASAVSHPAEVVKIRPELRSELLAANVATVKFDVQAGELTRISQFRPAGNQCIGLHPGPLVTIGRAMLSDLRLVTGAIEWEVASDQPSCVHAPAAEGEADNDVERPRA